MKRLAAALALLALLAAVATLAADCQNGIGGFGFRVLGPEAHDNLWQFASVRGWPATASTSYAGFHNNARLVYADGYFGVADSECAYGLVSPTGATLVIVAEYTGDANTTAQRAYYAAASFAATDPAPAIPDATMREVPPASATQDAGTVTVSWGAAPSQTEVIGYQVVRSADGLAGWTAVGTVTTDLSATDSPGTGTWYYAVQVAYLGTPTQQVSPHGLSSSVVVP